MTEPAPEGPKVRKEPPQGAETFATENITKDPKVCKE